MPIVGRSSWLGSRSRVVALGTDTGEEGSLRLGGPSRQLPGFVISDETRVSSEIIHHKFGMTVDRGPGRSSDVEDLSREKLMASLIGRPRVS